MEVAQGWTGELVIRTSEGHLTPNLENLFVIRDNQGKATHFADVVSDISERKKAEEEIRREDRVLRQMLKAQDRERQLVSYEIHDGLAQQLTAAIMQFQAFEQTKHSNALEAQKLFEAGGTMLTRK